MIDMTGLLKKPHLRALLLAGACTLAACSSTPATRPSATLYERLGGAPVMTGVVSRTLDRASTDPLTKRSFDGIKIAAIKDSLGRQICMISGGGCLYEGETMARAHHDSKIRPSEFDAMVTMLREELDRAGVDAGAKNDLLTLLAPMKREIVPSPGAPTR